MLLLLKEDAAPILDTDPRIRIRAKMSRIRNTANREEYTWPSVLPLRRCKGDGWLSWGGWVAKLLACPLAMAALLSSNSDIPQKS